MSSIPNAKLQVDVNAEHSCNNWKCCFGCKKVMKSPGQKQVNENEGISEETIEKTTYTFEKKTVHHQHTPPSMSRTIEVIKRIEEKTMSPEEEK